MLYRILFTVIFMFSLTGCASTHIQYVDPITRSIPEPHYVLQGIGTPIKVLFYYTAFEEIRDVDGSIINRPHYLDLLKKHNVGDRYKAITLTIEIANPTELEYSLYQTIINSKKNKVQSGGIINRSNQPYRQFVYKLPLSKDGMDVDYHIKLCIDSNEIMRIGHFKYRLKSKRR